MARKIKVGDKIILPSISKLNNVDILDVTAINMTGQTVIVTDIYFMQQKRISFSWEDSGWYILEKDAKLLNEKINNWREEFND